MSNELASLDCTAQAELVRTEELTPGELVDAAIERLERLNPTLNAVIHLALERARDRATSRELADGPFRGVPFLIKDYGCPEAGMPHHQGMSFLKEAGWTESEDSYLAARFKEVGLISLGRTNVPELALLLASESEAYGATRNPWNLEYNAGGSSGGSAAAVAAGIVPAAHASDGGGSIRGPASNCGLVGLKPTRGRSSLGPARGECWGGLDVDGVLTRTVRDSAALLDVISGFRPGDPYTAPAQSGPFLSEVGAPPGQLRVGFMSRPPLDLPIHPENAEAVARTAKALEELGHAVEEAHPDALGDQHAGAAFLTLVWCSTAHDVDAWARKLGRPVERKLMEPLTFEVVDRARQMSGPDYAGSLDLAHSFGRRLAAWWEGGFDLLLTPTQPQPPIRLGEMRPTAEEPLAAYAKCGLYAAFTYPFNLSGQPAISLPLHWTAEGLPIGSQLVAATGREDLLFRVAAQLEEALPWRDRLPCCA